MAVEESDDPFAAVDDSAWLRDALDDLTDRERVVLRLRFVDLLTQSEIAEQIGVSQMQVSRILRSTLTRLRAPAAWRPWTARPDRTRPRSGMAIP